MLQSSRYAIAHSTLHNTNPRLFQKVRDLVFHQVSSSELGVSRFKLGVCCSEFGISHLKLELASFVKANLSVFLVSRQSTVEVV
ncbi:hypothetical protein CEN50_03640 [Fischerella thermalis CCMEE 5268]|uniref:Uncharacterized protein n=1 Tax=Fischerella thermalis CCMEE 5268 TaxID=2019662 RepID=A0A2N6KKY4_9CYAN|nr:hypothetical protein CEN50_03640 [Fischerella thermalis CCMEE 5268]